MRNAVKPLLEGLLMLPLAILLSTSSIPETRGATAPSAAATRAPPVPPAAPALGTNLRELADWSTQRPFINLFKQARPWLTQCDNARDPDCNGRWDTGEADRLDLDAHGWVRSLPEPARPGYSIAGTVLDLPAGFPNGRYLLLYDGAGSLHFRLGAKLIEAESKPGRAVLEIAVHRGPIHIQIRATDPAGTGDYLRNLRLIAEGDEALVGHQTFNPAFLARTRPFQVLRFMEWQRINGSPIRSWDQRTQPDDATYSGPGGVPLEVMLELANTLHRPPWLNIPHQADEDYLAQMAELTRARLAPDLPVYVEYSNEVWNGIFAQNHWVGDQAEADWPGGKASRFTKLINGYGRRSAGSASAGAPPSATMPSA